MNEWLMNESCHSWMSHVTHWWVMSHSHLHDQPSHPSGQVPASPGPKTRARKKKRARARLATSSKRAFICDMADSCVTWLILMRHDSFICGIFSIPLNTLCHEMNTSIRYVSIRNTLCIYSIPYVSVRNTFCIDSIRHVSIRSNTLCIYSLQYVMYLLNTLCHNVHTLIRYVSIRNTLWIYSIRHVIYSLQQPKVDGRALHTWRIETISCFLWGRANQNKSGSDKTKFTSRKSLGFARFLYVKT